MTAPSPEFAAALEKGMTVSYWAKRQPRAPAVVAATGNRTYAELNARSNQLVHALRSHGIGAGDGVALLCANRTEFVEMFWATRRAGIRLTPVNWRLTGEEAAYIVNDCDAKAFIADARFLAVAEHVAANAPRARLRIAIGGALAGLFTQIVADGPSARRGRRAGQTAWAGRARTKPRTRPALESREHRRGGARATREWT